MAAKKNTSTTDKKVAFSTRIPDNLNEDIKRAAYWERLSVTALATKALEKEVERIRKKNGGELQPIPEQ